VKDGGGERVVKDLDIHNNKTSRFSLNCTNQNDFNDNRKDINDDLIVTNNVRKNKKSRKNKINIGNSHYDSKGKIVVSSKIDIHSDISATSSSSSSSSSCSSSSSSSSENYIKDKIIEENIINNVRKMYQLTKRNELNSAVEVFDSIPKHLHNIDSYNAIIYIYSKKFRNIEQTMYYFNLMTSSSSRSDNDNNNNTTSTTSTSNNNINDDDQNKNLIVANTKTYNLILHMFLKNKQYDKVLYYFNEMKINDIKLTLYSYNSIILSYCYLKKYNEIEIHINEMKYKYNIQPDIILYKSIIDLCSKNGEIYLAKKYLNRMLDEHNDNSEQNDKSSAQNNESLQEEFSLYNHKDETLNIYKNLNEKGILFNQNAYNIIINNYARIKDIDKVLFYFNEMKIKNIQPNFINYNTLIRILYKANEYEHAIHYINEMINNKIEITTNSFHFLLSIYRNLQLYDDGIKFYKLISKRKNIILSGKTYVTLIDIYYLSGNNKHKVIQYYNKMLYHNLYIRGMHVRNQVMDCYRQRHEYAKAIEIYNKILSNNKIKCNEWTYNIMLLIYHTYSSSSDNNISRISSSSIINNFTSNNNNNNQYIEQIIEIFYKLKNNNCNIDIDTYNVILKKYCNDDNIEKMKECFREIDVNKKLNIDTINMMIQFYCNRNDIFHAKYYFNLLNTTNITNSTTIISNNDDDNHHDNGKNNVSNVKDEDDNHNGKNHESNIEDNNNHNTDNGDNYMINNNNCSSDVTIKPTKETYIPMIKILHGNGHHDDAMMLYKQMKQLGLLSYDGDNNNNYVHDNDGHGGYDEDFNHLTYDAIINY
jgi:pentatricopeptide repeat protein